MSKTTVLTVDAPLSDFIEQEVASGRYKSAEDVVSAALRLLEDEKRVEALRAALIEGEESGPPREFDFAAFIESRFRA